jgi:hypothetical protein
VLLSPRRRCGQQEQHSRRVEQQGNHKDEAAQHILVAGAEQRREIADRPQVSLDLPALALDRGLLDRQVGKGLRLNRKLVGKAVALCLPSFDVCGAELGDR